AGAGGAGPGLSPTTPAALSWDLFPASVPPTPGAHDDVRTGDPHTGSGWPHPRSAPRLLPHHGDLATHRRPRDEPEAAEQGLLPDLRSGTRGDRRRRRCASPLRARLVLRLLPGPRPHLVARPDAARPPAPGRRRRGGPGVRRPV